MNLQDDMGKAHEYPVTGLEDLDRKIDVLVKHMANLKIMGTHLSLSSDGQISEVWENETLHKQYQEGSILLGNLIQQRTNHHG